VCQWQNPPGVTLMQQERSQNPATRADIAKIVHTSDTELISRIAATEVSYTELVEAFLRFTQEFQTDIEDSGPSHRVTRVMTILVANQGSQDCPDE
jgi:hypothetical protein